MAAITKEEKSLEEKEVAVEKKYRKKKTEKRRSEDSNCRTQTRKGNHI